jgi:uncharacterized protein YchJ
MSAHLLTTADRRNGSSSRLASCCRYVHDGMRVGHTIVDLLRQRFNGLALGHKELIGHYVLRHDPWLTAVLDKRGDALADNIMPNRL